MEKKQPSARAVRAAKRAAERKATEEGWQAKVAPHFGYLETTYGFRIAQVDASSYWAIRLVYQNATTAIVIDRSIEFSRVELSLIRLVDSAIPKPVIFVTPEVTLHQFLFDNLLQIRAPDALAKLHTLGGLGDEQVESSLAFLAQALNDYASDVLRGNFTIFAALEAMAKQRASEHSPQITILVPSDTTKEHKQQLAEKTQQMTPTVPVVVKEYQRRAGRKRKRPTSTPDDAV